MSIGRLGEFLWTMNDKRATGQLMYPDRLKRICTSNPNNEHLS